MANSNGIITDPVGILDIQQVLGYVGGGDLGTLCQCWKINMWAKYKPVIRQNLIDTKNQLNADNTWKTYATLREDAWWRADDQNHGLSVPSATAAWSPQGFLDALNYIANNKIDGGKNGWIYNPPTGGMAAPFRQIDFNRYNHNAPNPVQRASGPDEIVSAASQVWEYSVSLMEVVPVAYDSRDYIVPTDLRIDGTIYQTLYLGIALFNKVNNAFNAIAWVSGDGTNAGNTWQGTGIINSDQQDGPSIPDPNGSAVIGRFKDGGDYYALPLYFTKSNLQQPQTGQSFIGTTSGCKIIPVPYTDFIHFTAEQRSSLQAIVFPSISNKKISFLGAFSCSVTLSSAIDGYNGSSSSFQVDVYFARTDWSLNDADITSSNVLVHHTKTYSSFADNTTDTPSDLAISLTGIDISKSWMVVVKVAGEAKTFMLIQADQPILNT